VVRGIEPDFFLVDCLGSGAVCVLTGCCALTGIVSGALQSFMQHLDRHTLADLLPASAKSQSRPGRSPGRSPSASGSLWPQVEVARVQS
jgi:Rrf2 family nitric oxide-sensitive transcriptional repressor